MPLVALVFRDNARTTKPSQRGARDVCSLVDLPAIEHQLRRKCEAVGVEHTDQVVALTDGGAGFEEYITEALAGIVKHPDLHPRFLARCRTLARVRQGVGPR